MIEELNMQKVYFSLFTRIYLIFYHRDHFRALLTLYCFQIIIVFTINAYNVFLSSMFVNDFVFKFFFSNHIIHKVELQIFT